MFFCTGSSSAPTTSSASWKLCSSQKVRRTRSSFWECWGSDTLQLPSPSEWDISEVAFGHTDEGLFHVSSICLLGGAAGETAQDLGLAGYICPPTSKHEEAKVSPELYSSRTRRRRFRRACGARARTRAAWFFDAISQMSFSYRIVDRRGKPERNVSMNVPHLQK